MSTEPPQVSPASALARHRWDNTTDRVAATEPGRSANIARYADQVDPDGLLPPAERMEQGKRAFYADLGRRSGQARRARRAQRETVRDLDEVVDQIVNAAPELSEAQRARLQALLST